MDTLGFDKETKSFKLIEYKRDKNYSVIDQGYAYLALLVNNKADFILVYNERGEGKGLKKNEVVWEQSRVIFISPSFTMYQRKAIEFKDLPIQLWEVKEYSNNTILFNQIQSPEKSESVYKLSQKSEVIRRVNREVKVFNEEDRLIGCKETIRSLYRELRESILLISSDVQIKPQKKYVAFVHKRNFVDIVVWKSSLSLYLNMKKGTLYDHQNMARDVSNVGHWGNGDYEVKITKSTDIGYVLSLIRQSYDKN